VERAKKEVLRHLNAILFNSQVHDRWSFEQLPMVQRIMNTGVTPAQLILNNSISLSKQILMSQRVLHIQNTTRPTGQIALSDRMDKWISKQNTREKQSKTDHHALVEYDPTVTEYPTVTQLICVFHTSSRSKCQAPSTT
jgi:hypothetical protein